MRSAIGWAVIIIITTLAGCRDDEEGSEGAECCGGKCDCVGADCAPTCDHNPEGGLPVRLRAGRPV